jgi:LmbE family N-acetylglucosaminyl deacetylase
MAAVDAVYPAARNAMAFPHLASTRASSRIRSSWLYLFFSDRPNAWVDVSDTLETKLAALREHASQLRKPDELEEMDARLGARGWPARSASRRPSRSAFG